MMDADFGFDDTVGKKEIEIDGLLVNEETTMKIGFNEVNNLCRMIFKPFANQETMLRKHYASYQYFPVYPPLDTFVETKFAFRGAKMFPNKFKNIFVAETTFPSLPAMRNSIAEILIVEDRMTHILTPYIWNSPEQEKPGPPTLERRNLQICN